MKDGICRFCGQPGTGPAFNDWVKDTFTNFDRLLPGDIICNGCLFWFDQRSTELQRRMGKEKPQKMQNYSHLVIGGEWRPLSKGDKAEMRRALLEMPFPELAAIADSGQKHIAFRARRNPPGQAAGWVQFEEQCLWVEPSALAGLLEVIEELYQGFSKSEIESGEYFPHRILQFGLDRWQALEERIRAERGKLLFALAIFLAQKAEEKGAEDGSRDQDAGCRSAEGDLAGHTEGVQEPLPAQHLGAISEPGEVVGLHRQLGEVRQLSLFEPGSGDRKER